MTVRLSPTGEEIMPQDEGPDLGLRVPQPAPRQARQTAVFCPVGKGYLHGVGTPAVEGLGRRGLPPLAERGEERFVL
jgi:hypothetical protein